MKKIKYIVFLLSFFAINFLCVAKVNALDYFINNLDLNGTTLTIDGYAYDIQKQDYTSSNHYYSLIIEDANGNMYKEYPLSLNDDYGVDLSILGYDYDCGAYGEYTGRCKRNVSYIGFSGVINLNETGNSLYESLRTSNKDKFYLRLVIYEINQYGQTRRISTRIKTFPALIKDNNPYEFKNTVFNIIKSDYGETFRMNYSGVIAKGSPNSNNITASSLGVSAPGGRQNIYVGTETFGSGIFSYKNIARGSDRVWWIQTSGWLCTEWYCRDRTFDSNSGNYTLQPNGSTNFWISTIRINLLGKDVFLTKTMNKYISVNEVVTKTVKEDDLTTITAKYTNSKSNNPVTYEFWWTENGNKKELIKDYNNNECKAQNQLGSGSDITVTCTVKGTKVKRELTLFVTEEYTGNTKSLQSMLYAASNENQIVTADSGEIQLKNPIMAIKRPGESIAKYYETITFSNPQNYLITAGDYNGGKIRRQTSLSYESDTSDYGNINKYFNEAINEIDSPKTNFTLNPYVNANGKNISTDDYIYVAYTDLNTKGITTTYKGVGINNATIVLESNYRFDNQSEIEYIDSYTTEKTENSKITLSAKNNTERNVKWEIWNDNNLVKSGQDTWTGSKEFNLNDYIVNRNGMIRFKIVEPNGVITELQGETYVADEKTITLSNEINTYTSDTPVRVLTTPSDKKKYVETIKLDEYIENSTILAGRGITNKLVLNYLTTSEDIILNNDEITALSIMPKQIKNLDYTENADGIYVPLESTNQTNSSNTLEFPEVYVERKEGTLYRKNDPRSAGLDLINGKRYWYTSFTENEGKYDFTTIINHVGVNATNIKIYNSYNVEGSVIGEQKSKYKVVRVQNPSNPVFTYHKTYTLKELLEKFGKE